MSTFKEIWEMSEEELNDAICDTETASGKRSPGLPKSKLREEGIDMEDLIYLGVLGAIIYAIAPWIEKGYNYVF